MKAKNTRGQDFRGVLSYVFQSSKRPLIVAGSLFRPDVHRRIVAELSAEFDSTLSLHVPIANPVWHSSLSLPPGEQIIAVLWQQLATRYMQEMGFSDRSVWIAVEHHDREHCHIHIIASRIELDGRVWHGRRDVFTSIAATQKLEREFNLTLTPELDPHPKDEEEKATRRKRPRKPRRQELDMARRGVVAEKITLDQIILAAAGEAKTLADFVDYCALAGVRLIPSGKTGAAQGMSLASGQVIVKFSSLKHGGWKAFSNGFYDPIRDQTLINQLRKQAADLERAHTGVIRRVVPEVTSPIESPVPTESIAQPKPHGRGRRRALDAFAVDLATGAYRWRKYLKSRPVFVDKGDRIVVTSHNTTVIQAALQLAQDKFDDALEVTGSEAFRRQVWQEAQALGIPIQGYTPTAAELAAHPFNRSLTKRTNTSNPLGLDESHPLPKIPSQSIPQTKPAHKKPVSNTSNQKTPSSEDIQHERDQQPTPIQSANINQDRRADGYRSSEESRTDPSDSGATCPGSEPRNTQHRGTESPTQSSGRGDHRTRQRSRQSNQGTDHRGRRNQPQP